VENRNRTVWIIVGIIVVLACCLLALVAAAVIGAGWFGLRIMDRDFGDNFTFDQIIESSEMRFDVGEAPALLIENFAGDINVQTGAEGTIEVVASRRAGSAENIQGIVIEPSQEGDTVRIVTRKPSDRLLNASVELDVTVPPGTRVEITNGAGEVTIEDVEGEIVADTGAGNIVVRGSEGQVRLDTGAGDVDYAGNPQGTSTFGTGAGNIEISLPADFAGSVELDTGIGSVDLGGFDVIGGVSPRSAQGTIGTGGGPIIQAHTGAGDIDLVRR
jgi:hypothetical protein